MRRGTQALSLLHTALKAKEWLELFMAGAHELMARLCKEEVAVVPSDAAVLRSLLSSGECIAEAFNSTMSSIDTLKANVSLYEETAPASNTSLCRHRLKLPAYPSDLNELANVGAEAEMVSLELRDKAASLTHQMCGLHACKWSNDDTINISEALRALEGTSHMLQELQDFPLDFFCMLENQLTGSRNHLPAPPTTTLQTPTPTAAPISTSTRPQQRKRASKKRPAAARAGPIDPTLTMSDNEFDAILQEFRAEKKGEKGAEGDVKSPVDATPAAAAATRRCRRRTAQRSRAPGSTVAVSQVVPSAATPTPTCLAPARAPSPVAAQEANLRHAEEGATEVPMPEGSLGPSPSPGRATYQSQAQTGDNLNTSSSSVAGPKPRLGARDGCGAAKGSSRGRRNSKRVQQRGMPAPRTTTPKTATPTAAAVNTPARPQQSKRNTKGRSAAARAGPVDPTLSISDHEFDAILKEFSAEEKAEKAAEGDITQHVVAPPAAAAATRRRRRQMAQQRSHGPGATVAVSQVESSTPTPTPSSVAPARAASHVAAQAAPVEHADQSVTEVTTPEGSLGPSPSPCRVPCHRQARRGHGVNTSSPLVVAPEPRLGAQDGCIAGKAAARRRRNSKGMPQRGKEVMEDQEEERLLAEAVAQAKAEREALEDAAAAQNEQAHVRTRRRPLQARVALTRLRTSCINTA